MHKLPFTFQFNRDLKPEDLTDMDQVLQLHQLFNNLFQWSIENKRFNIASHWEELGETFQKIFLRGISFKDLIEITKGWNPNSQFKLLEEREAKIRENQATIQAIEKEWTQKEDIMNPSGSQGVGKPKSLVGSHYSGSNKTVTKSHHYSQFKEVSSRRQGPKGKNKNTFRQRKKK
ncbi:hypothetical protein O181_023876 [Austropuccinia psidii MF-1]|uniref:Uncharacterized protein n=1 Tax=Austropuccinia psidii MF-1 TaxID=1389203 RepID=A0A9Q3CK90_9BASI|nr:hypothetical protein [Austropuccinia psidii MF-1]